MSIKMEKTERGFYIARFKDRYDMGCSLQESSLAFERCVWLGCDEGLHFDQKNMPIKEPQEKCCARMHLTQDMAKDIIVLLQHFVDHGELPQPEPEKEDADRPS